VAATATTWPHGLEPQLAPPDLTGLEARPADELLAWAIAPCTRPTRPGEDERAGRWWWEADPDRRSRTRQITAGGA